MKERHVRGYMITTQFQYFAQQVGDAEADRYVRELPKPEVYRQANPVEWYPVEHLAALNRAIATVLGGGDEAKTRDAFVNLGRFAAREATNTFLRLLMRVLTPNLLAKRFPQLWSRDCTVGTAAVDVQDKGFTIRLDGVEGFDHCAPTSMGFASFVLSQMGKEIVLGDLKGWSLATPGPPTVTVELRWTN